MKVLFLDIEGVLNNRAQGSDPGYPNFSWLGHIQLELVWNLNSIVDRTGCALVLSSSWRHAVLLGQMSLDEFAGRMRDLGVMGELIDVTPHLPGRPRAVEIKTWLRDVGKARGVREFVVLDDDPEARVAGATILVNRSVGLTTVNAEDAVRLLKRQ